MREKAQSCGPETSTTQNIAHGGDPHAAMLRYGIEHENWLDLSTGINPCSYPAPIVPEKIFRDLPTNRQELQLRAAAQKYYGVGQQTAILAAPGSQNLINKLPQFLMSAQDNKAKHVVLLAPGYGEYHRAFRGADWKISSVSAQQIFKQDIGQCDAVVLTNPNNPDGIRFSPKTILALAKHQNAQDPAGQGRGWLIVDEAFCDLEPERSVASYAGTNAYPNLVVLRSIGKFFGLAGLRLGFLLGSKKLITAALKTAEPWHVSTPAHWLGRLALEDLNWQEKTRNRLRRQAEDLKKCLLNAGLDCIGGTDLFQLVFTRHAAMLHEHLAREGIWTRDFAAHPFWLRVGLPGNHVDMKHLERSLASFNGPQNAEKDVQECARPAP